jgi:GTPase SAR1 family protein
VDGVACTLDIMDTAGQEEYTALVDQFMKNGHGFVLVYSITSPTTFKLINDLHTRIQRYLHTVTATTTATTMTTLGLPSVEWLVWWLTVHRVHGMEMPMVLIANKCDLEDQREVPKEKGEQWAKDRHCPFFEVSAKTNHNVNECFIAVVKEINSWRDAHPDKAAKVEPAKKKKCSLF